MGGAAQGQGHAERHDDLPPDLTWLVEERTQLQDELQEAWTEADQVRIARDLTAMFDEVKALADHHAELHADRARLKAELEKAPWP